MSSKNPYQSPRTSETRDYSTLMQRSKLRWALFGSFIAAALPVSIGIREVAHQWAYAASVTLGPNEAFCGNPIPVLLVCIVGPFCGSIGAVVGVLCAVAADSVFPVFASNATLKSTEQ